MSEERKNTKQKLVDSYVNWYAFTWAVGILLTLILLSVSLATSAKDLADSNKNKVDVQNSDIQWIKSTLLEIKTDVKSLN